MATYNHGPFVGQAINSVLAQRGVELEFLIADDGSVDLTQAVVATYHDPRIKFFPNGANRGACAVINELIQKASGEFIAIINSDDSWIGDDKLAEQLHLMHDNPTVGACFGRARFIDRDGRAIDKSSLPEAQVFEQGNRSRGAWLRHFFEHGNCLCHPTVVIRRSCYGALGMYDNRLRQLPDLEMWVRLVKRYDIHVSDREMVAFRHLPGESASSFTSVNDRRLLHEWYFILKAFFYGVSRKTFTEGFGDALVKAELSAQELSEDVHLQIEQCLLFLRKEGGESHIYKLIGLEQLYQLLGSEAHRQMLADHYGIDDRTFHTLAGQVYALDRASRTIPLAGVSGWTLLGEIKRRATAAGRSVLRLPFTRVEKGQ
jgi:glycosyltransferase involved in cell wall biosynthesis